MAWLSLEAKTSHKAGQTITSLSCQDKMIMGSSVCDLSPWLSSLEHEGSRTVECTPGTRQSRLAGRAGQLMMLGLAHHVLELTGRPIAQR